MIEILKKPMEKQNKRVLNIINPCDIQMSILKRNLFIY